MTQVTTGDKRRRSAGTGDETDTSNAMRTTHGAVTGKQRLRGMCASQAFCCLLLGRFCPNFGFSTCLGDSCRCKDRSSLSGNATKVQGCWLSVPRVGSLPPRSATHDNGQEPEQNLNSSLFWNRVQTTEKCVWTVFPFPWRKCIPATSRFLVKVRVRNVKTHCEFGSAHLASGSTHTAAFDFS